MASAIAGAIGALCVLAIALAIQFVGLLGPIPREEFPAWVQAIGSVAAIVAASAFAIWVPLHMRNLAERDVARRALNNCIVVSQLVGASWGNLRGVVERGEFHALTPELVAAEGEAIRAIASQIPISVLSMEAVTNLHIAVTWIYGVAAVAQRLANAPDLATAAAAVEFGKTAVTVDGPSSAFALMKPVKVKGYWTVCDPSRAQT